MEKILGCHIFLTQGIMNKEKQKIKVVAGLYNFWVHH